MAHWRPRTATLIAAAGAGSIVAGTVAWLLGHGFEFSAGPLYVSATSPRRLLLNGLLALLAAAVVRDDRTGRGRAAALAAVVSSFCLVLAAGSPPRLTGDGAEYVAMAARMASARPPSLDTAEPSGSSLRVEAPPPLHRGADGRWHFVHFWLYPAVVAPFAAVARAAGLHWNHAFTLVNVLLFGMSAHALLRRLPASAALVLLVSPILWWIDKAHPEVFIFALLAAAFATEATHPVASMILLGLLGAQNPVFDLVLVPAVAWQFHRAAGPGRRRIAAGAMAALGLAAMHPVYYLAHLGRLTPLGGTLALDAPGLTAILTPLLDLFIGICWQLPGLLVVALLVDWRLFQPGGGPRVHGAALAIVAVLMLAVFAMSGNVNHGGTAGPSRYGVWMLPFLVPLLLGMLRPAGWRAGVIPVLAVAAMAHATWAFHPKHHENAVVASRLARWAADRAPWIYDPLPEVFAERFFGADGAAALPVASPHCGKVLLIGEGTSDVRWPVPCAPARVPDECLPRGITCYATRLAGGGYGFSRPPRQRGFIPAIDRDMSWRSVGDMAWLPVSPDWSRLASVEPMSTASAIRNAGGVERIRALQSERFLVAWVYPLPTSRARVQVRPGWTSARAWWVHRPAGTITPIGRLHEGQWLETPGPGVVILLAASGE